MLIFEVLLTFTCFYLPPCFLAHSKTKDLLLFSFSFFLKPKVETCITCIKKKNTITDGFCICQRNYQTFMHMSRLKPSHKKTRFILFIFFIISLCFKVFPHYIKMGLISSGSENWVVSSYCKLIISDWLIVIF